MPTERSRKRRAPRPPYGVIATSILLVVALLLGVYGVGRRVVPQMTPALCRIVVGDTTLSYDPDQTQHAATIAGVARRKKLPRRAATIALATALQESKLRNLDHGDRDSLGLFQQRPSQGWGTPAQLQDPVYASERFYAHLVRIRDWQDRPLTEVAQAVQRSGYPDAYAQHEQEADVLARAFLGEAPAAVTCRLPDATTAVQPTDLVAQMTNQLGVFPTPRGGKVVATFDKQATAWAAAHWAVAHASRAGVDEVVVGDRRWVRGKDRSSTRWEQADTGAEPTEIRISLTP